MLGYMFAPHKGPLEDLLDPKNLREAWQSTYRLPLGRAMTDLLSQNYTKSTVVPGHRHYQIQAIVMVPAFRYIVEALFAIAASFAAVLAYLISRRPSKLSYDPSTVTALMSLVADDRDLLNRLTGLGLMDDETLETAIKDVQFELSSGTDESASRLIVKQTGYSTNAGNQLEPVSVPRTIPTISPKEFRLWVVCMFLILNLIALVATIILKKQAGTYGSPLASQNRFVRQLLQHYIPISLATLIEPLWVLITRTFCLLQPYDELRNGKAKSRNSIDLDYTSRPPHLVFFKALRARHITLAIVCLITLLANLLAIAFSGIFNEVTIAVPYDEVFVQPYGPTFVNGTFESTDAFGRIMTNLTVGTPFPAWSDDRFFYLPFDDLGEETSTFQRSANTRAFGTQLECRAVSFASIVRDTTTIPVNDGVVSRCKISYDGDSSNEQISLTYPSCLGIPLAQEYLMRLEGRENTTVAEIERCEKYLFAAWKRAPISRCVSDQTMAAEDFSGILCRTEIVTGEAYLRVDVNGYVQEVLSVVTRDNITEQFFPNHTTELISGFNYYVHTNAKGLYLHVHDWHNYSIPSDREHYLMAMIANSTSILDPALPPPTFETTVQLLSSLTSRLFSVHLADSYTIILIIQPTQTERFKDLLSNPRHESQCRSRFSITSVVILSLYIVAAALMYIRRPARFLPRLPITMASVIATFASSHAVRDFEGTAGMSRKQRSTFLAELGNIYGYGYSIGTDGKVRAGLEKQPFLGRQRKATDESVGETRQLLGKAWKNGKKWKGRIGKESIS